MTSPAWMADAACLGLTAIFFPEPINGSRKYGPNAEMQREYEPAAAVCASCRVKQDCLSYALALPRVHVQGMFGGLRPSQLDDLRRARRRSAA